MIARTKKTSKCISMLLSLMMLFAMTPMIAGSAYAEEGATVIKTSEMTANEPFVTDEDTIIEIDADITVPYILVGVSMYTSERDLTIKGDGTHTLKIVTDDSAYNQAHSLLAGNITIEKGSIIDIDHSIGQGYLYAENEFTMNGGELKAKNSKEYGWNPGEVNKATINGGNIEFTDTTGTTAFNTEYLTVNGGKLKASSRRGIFVGKKAVISGGMVEANGTAEQGILIRDNDDSNAQFIMTGGALLTSTTRSNYAFQMDCSVDPYVGDKIKITDPDNGMLMDYIDENSNKIYTVVDENGTPATTANFKTSFENAVAIVPSTTFIYNGKKKTPSITVKDGKKTLVKGTDYKVTYSGKCINAGTYKGKIVGTGIYANDSVISFSFKINKAKNPLTVSGKTKTVKYSKVKKASQKLAVKEVIKTSKKGQGTVTYVKSKGTKNITIAKKTGKVTVKKGTKKGTYPITVKVKAAGTKNYKSLTKTVIIKIKVK